MTAAASRSPGLDLARTLGVSGVILAHTTLFLERFGFSMETLLPCHIWGGLFGVELFFALSGLLIGEMLFRQVLEAPSPKVVGVFLLRRWLRTLPAYYVVLLVMVLHALWLNQPMDALWRYLVFLQNSPPEYAAFFGVSWSLSIEQWAYIVTPLLLWLGSAGLARVCTLTPAQRHLVLLAAAIVLSCLWRTQVALEPALWDNDFRKQVPLRLDTVLFGVLLAWIKIHRADIYARLGTWPVFLICAAGLWGLAGTYNMSLFAPEGNVFIKGLGFSLVDACFAVSLSFLDVNVTVRARLQPSTIAGRVCLYGSRYAYSLYLVHLSVFVFFLQRMGDVSPLLGTVWYLAALGASVAVAVLLYHTVEKPFMDMRSRFSLRRA